MKVYEVIIFDMGHTAIDSRYFNSMKAARKFAEGLQTAYNIAQWPVFTIKDF